MIFEESFPISALYGPPNLTECKQVIRKGTFRIRSYDADSRFFIICDVCYRPKVNAYLHYVNSECKRFDVCLKCVDMCCDNKFYLPCEPACNAFNYTQYNTPLATAPVVGTNVTIGVLSRFD
jgi:hypothetical protein